MLSALAKYIFGGVMNDAQEESMQCETREVNDWLLINMPDQAVDDIDFDSDDEKSPESEDDELEAIPDETEIDEDDILTSLPLLLAQDKHVCDTLCIESAALQQSLDMATRVAIQSILIDECSENFQVIPESSYVNHSLYYPSDYSLVMVIKQLFRDQVIRSRKAIREQLSQNLTQVLKRTAPLTSSAKTIVQPILIPTIPKVPNVQAPKDELLVQIKQLKPSQKAMQRDIRKLNSKSYLNRQNKNYIYESSVKTNRRSNLQRHHSGANNNRKCC